MEEKKESRDELFEQEEKCQKAIRTVSRAMLMRLVVTVLMVVVVAGNPEQVWAWGLAAFVLVINLMGILPLWKEFKSQRQKLKALIESE